MFFDRLSEACAIRNTSPSAVALQIGRSKSNVTGWKKGQIPSSDTLTALAENLISPQISCWSAHRLIAGTSSTKTEKVFCTM